MQYPNKISHATFVHFAENIPISSIKSDPKIFQNVFSQREKIPKIFPSPLYKCKFASTIHCL